MIDDKLIVTENTYIKAAILEMSPQFFREIFYLPDEAEIVDIQVPIDKRGILEIKIYGAGWNTPPGGAIRRAIGYVVRDEPGIKWDFMLGDKP